MLIKGAPTMFNPAGRLAVIGYEAVTPLGLGLETYNTRIGRFVQGVPEYARIMKLARRDPQSEGFIRLAQIVAGRAVDIPPESAGALLSAQELFSEFGLYIDENIGIRIPLPGDTAFPDLDVQRYIDRPGEVLTHDVTINGRLYKAGEKLHLPKPAKSLPVVHAGMLPSRWNIQEEMGLSGNPFTKFSRLHWIMARVLGGALLMTGAPWSEIAAAVPPEQRGVAAGPGMAPGEVIEDGMVNPRMGEPIDQDQLARYLADNPAFWLAKWLDARHATTRIGACNTGICNIEDLITYMRSGQILFGAVSTFEAAVTVSSIRGFHAQTALATNQAVASLKDHPSLISRPGLVDRAGFVLGEGGGILLVMDMELAMDLGLIIYGELLSAKTALGGLASFNPAIPTKGGQLAFAQLLKDWAEIDNISPKAAANRIDAINGHGTSTPAGDPKGISNYDAVLQKYERDPQRPVWLTYGKGGPRLEGIETARTVGANGISHLLGGASMTSTVENIQMHEGGVIPPAVVAYDQLVPEAQQSLHLMFPTSPVSAEINYAVAEAQGFGDSNGFVATRGYRPELYRGGREIQSKQAERMAWRDEKLEDIRRGRAKAGDHMPELKIKKDA